MSKKIKNNENVVINEENVLLFCKLVSDLTTLKHLKVKKLFVGKILLEILKRVPMKFNLTVYHPKTLKLFYEEKMDHLTLPICNLLINSNGIEDSTFKIRDYMKYYYYSSLILIRNGKYFKAFEAVQKLLILPEKYAKMNKNNEYITLGVKIYIVLQLLFQGEKIPPVKSEAIKTYLKSRHGQLKEYEYLRNLIKCQDVAGLSIWLDINNESLIRDNVKDLCEVILICIKKKHLLNLAKIYCYADFDQLSTMVYSFYDYNQTPVEHLFLNLIFQNKLECKITDYKIDDTANVITGDIQFDQVAATVFNFWDLLNNSFDELNQLNLMALDLNHHLNLDLLNDIKLYNNKETTINEEGELTSSRYYVQDERRMFDY
ncbi:hypothetical protein K502DRAFT_328887 [Neoconidiobolus thromboides FSU 785]|nr:hypothetical protein K502DRAFT_328887 [Neoconidiobolus thromboides FSU 785]